MAYAPGPLDNTAQFLFFGVRTGQQIFKPTSPLENQIIFPQRINLRCSLHNQIATHFVAYPHEPPLTISHSPGGLFISYFSYQSFLLY